MTTRSPFSILHEWFKSKSKTYSIHTVSIKDKFSCVLKAEDVEIVGYGPSKKQAKQNAAKMALDIFKVSNVKEEKKEALPTCFRNFVGELNQYSSKCGMKYPNYIFVAVLSDGKFYFTCNYSNLKSDGIALTKMSAKQIAARNMIELIEMENPCKHSLGSKQTDVQINDKDKVIKLFNRLSSEQQSKMLPIAKAASQVLESQAEIEISDCITSLKKELRTNGIDYDLKDMCKEPPVVALVIKGTHFTLMGTGLTKNEAIRCVLQDTLLVKKYGCSF